MNAEAGMLAWAMLVLLDYREIIPDVAALLREYERLVMNNDEVIP